MAKRIIYLPDELKKRIALLRKQGVKINVSAICQQALKEELHK